LNRRAFVIILVALALFFIAATIKSGWLYLVSSALVSLVVLGFISGRHATRGLDFSRECPGNAFEGEPFEVRLRVRNHGHLCRYFLVVLDRPFEHTRRRGLLAKIRERRAEIHERLQKDSAPSNRRGTGRERHEHSRTVAVEKIASGSELNVEYELSAPRRGVYQQSEITVSSGGVLGTAGVSRTIQLQAAMTVFPRIYPITSFPFEPRTIAAPVEAYEWSRKGIGQDYYGVREYVRGDSLRHIHWKSSARQGQLIVREYQQEFRPSSCIVVLLAEPLNGDGNKNSLEDGLRCAASILNYYETLGSKPRLVIPRAGSFEVLEEATLYGYLEALAVYRPFDRPEGPSGWSVLGEALSHARALHVPGSAVAVVTNAPAESIAAALEDAPDVEGSSLVAVVDESYGSGRDTGLALLEMARLESAASRRVNLFVVTGDQEISECLNEPLSITAS
jgi:uncharacterized protein (DUF58 family)